MTRTGTGERLPIPDGDRSTRPLPGELDYDAFAREEVLGRGGNATVYRATLRDDPGQVLALKEPHVPEDVPETVVDRFRSEAETWSSLDDHPHVVTVHAWGTEPHPWMALEYADGGSLLDRGPGDTNRELWTGACVAAAIDHAHRDGVAHLDLKPGNVLLRESSGDAWALPGVADWGMARLLRSGTVNLEGLSPRYAAPEQFAPDRYGSPGAGTDVYGLGVVLYELLVGAPPFDGPPRVLRDAVLGEPPPPASGRNTDLPAAVDDVLDRALAKEPADRYDSMYGFRRELERLLADRTGYEPDGTVAGTVGAALRTGRPASSPAGTADTGGSASRASPYERALALSEEGFVQLTEGYFARREPVPPLSAWRRGVTLADAHAGRAVERTVPDDDGQGRVPLADRLLDGLREGTDHVVLGPPGSGKSTVCKRVASEWFDRGRGPVFYRESGRAERFDSPDALARRVTDADGHAVVVVEDAVRPEAAAVFEFLDRVADSDEVTVLLDARETEWRDAGRGADAFGTDPVAAGREAVEPVYVPRPDAREHERFVRAVEEAADRTIDVDVEQLRGDVERAAAGESGPDGTRPGELFSLLHRLTALARDPLTDGEATTLTDAVAEVYDRLSDASEATLDVGVCANVLNAAGIGVHPELLYAVVPEDPLAVEDAVDVMDGRVVFPREADWNGGTTTYPSVHEAWSTAFLAHCLDAEGEQDARERFGRVVTRVLSLAGDADAREQVRASLRGDAPYVDRIEQDRGTWADESVEAVYVLGRERPKLAPLFGTGRRDSVGLPDACSGAVAARRPVWLGQMFLAGGYYDRAERTFERLPEAGERAVERLLGLGRAAASRGEYEAAAERARECLSLVEDDGSPAARARAHLRLGQALEGTADFEAAGTHFEAALEGFEATGDRGLTAETLNDVGTVAGRQGDYDRAREYFQRSLALARDLGDRQRAVENLTNLGLVVGRQGDYDRAREYHRQSLELARDIGDRQTEANTLGNLGLLAEREGDYDRARELFRRSLRLKRDLGDRNGETVSLANLGLVAMTVGDYDRAEEYYGRALELDRELGDRQKEAVCLVNIGDIARIRGEYDLALDRYEEGLDIASELGDRQVEADLLEGLGKVALRRGEYDRARDRFDRGLELARDIDDRLGRTQFHGNLGDLALRRGDDERAREHFEQGLERARALGDPMAAARNQRRLGDVARRAGRHDRARELLDAALAAVEDERDRLELARVRLSRARSALARGEVDAARQRGESARETFADLGATHWAARGRRLLGRVAAEAGDTDTAREHWRAALETFEAVGAPQDALATLRDLVEICREVNDEDASGRWCDRAGDLLASAWEPVADRHRGEVGAACDGREDA